MPRAILPQGQTDAGHEKAAQNQKPVSKNQPFSKTERWSCVVPLRGGVLVISVHLLSLSVYSFFYPLHFIQQGVDLKLHHILRHLRKQEGHGVWNCLVDHHHGQGEVAK